jgi:hypothetical protein
MMEWYAIVPRIEYVPVLVLVLFIDAAHESSGRW